MDNVMQFASNASIDYSVLNPRHVTL